jgi:DNA-binding NarL/FixJ family response regulator
MAAMKTQENISRRPIPPQLQNQDGILLASEVFHHTSFSMPVKSQPPGISVSLICDDASASEVFCDWIRSAEGFSMVSCHNITGSALAALPNEMPAIVILDVDLPDRSAFDCLRLLKSILQQTQFVAFVPKEDADHIFEMLTAGAIGYLLRQATRNELLAELKLIHAGGSPMSRAVAQKVLEFFRHQSPVDSSAELSPRETRILRLLASGSSHREVAAALNISVPMVSTYIRSIYEKLHLHTASKVLR